MEEQDGDVVTVGIARDRVGECAAFVAEEVDGVGDSAAVRKAECTGRPIGSTRWLEDMQGKIGQRLIVEKPGPKVRGLLQLSR